MDRVEHVGRWIPVVLLVSLLAPPAAAQEEERGLEGCEWIAPTEHLVRSQIGGSAIVRVRKPHLLCPDGSRLRADSARQYESPDFHQYRFFGNVFFEDAERILEADNAQYYRREGRLEAQGDVRLERTSDRTLMTGERLEYLQAREGRTEDELWMSGGRPHATLYLRPDTSAGTGVETEADSAALETDSAEVADTAEVRDPEAAADTAVAEEPDAMIGPPLPPVPEPEPDTVAVPYDVDADRIYVRGERFFRATGRVEIHRDSLDAFADTAEYDQGRGLLDLRKNARMEGEGYDLTASRIRMLMPANAEREVDAREDAVLEGEELRLAGPRILLFLVDGVLERVVSLAPRPEPEADEGEGAAVAEPGEEEAVRGRRPSAEEPGEPEVTPDSASVADSVSIFEVEHPDRAVVKARDLRLVADSVEILTPGEVLDRLVAVGGARGESTGRDSVNTAETPEIIRRDWIEGDTVRAHFEEVTVPDTTAGAEPGATVTDTRLRRLVALVRARSLYRLAPADTVEAPVGDTASAAGEGEAPDSMASGSEVSDSAVAAGPAGVSDTTVVRRGPRLAIHYVVGEQITIVLEDGEVQRMEVVGQVRGQHLEPVARSSPPGDAGGAGTRRGSAPPGGAGGPDGGRDGS